MLQITGNIASDILFMQAFTVLDALLWKNFTTEADILAVSIAVVYLYYAVFLDEICPNQSFLGKLNT